jgi:hypothetical protein
MTLYNSENDRTPGKSLSPGQPARTHALIIGVSDYRHLPGGSGTLNPEFDLEQPTCSSIAAVAFARWVIEEMNNPRAPLGTVELLTSPPLEFVISPRLKRQTLDATMNNVEAAFERWMGRANSNPDNIALFYFCGHGLMKADLNLLLSDFAAKPLKPFDTAVNINKTYEGMARCAARTQCYFLDCCQDTKWIMSQQTYEPGRVLVPAQFGTLHTGDAPKYLATAPSLAAFGVKDGMTVFTTALLDCLARRGTRRKADGKWVVTTAALSEALGDAPAELPVPGGVQMHPTDGCHTGRSVLHELSCAPDIDVSLRCDPHAANALANFRMHASTPPHKPAYDYPVAGPWQFRASANHYLAAASFPKGQFQKSEFEIWVLPPGPASQTVEIKK